MAIGQSMLAGFDHEMANTRKTQAGADDKFAWTPHEKSFPWESWHTSRKSTHLDECQLSTINLIWRPVGTIKTPECQTQRSARGV